MEATWIVAANAERARFFSQLGASRRWAEVGDMLNTAARLRARETHTDSLGRFAASGSRHGSGAPGQPSGYEPRQLPAEREAERFARSVASHLLQAHRHGRYGHLVLVASPEFLGMLRSQIDPHLAGAVKLAIDHDYTHCDARELHERVESHRMGGR